MQRRWASRGSHREVLRGNRVSPPAEMSGDVLNQKLLESHVDG